MKRRSIAKKWFYAVLIGCGLMSLQPCFAQQLNVKGIVKNGQTNEVLKDVRIYVNRDTTFVTTNAKGVFNMKIAVGAVLCFRKAGYKWQNEYITDGEADKIIALLPSVHTQPQFDEVEVDGKLIPQEEWNDVNADYIQDVGVKNVNQKVRLIIKTKLK